MLPLAQSFYVYSLPKKKLMFFPHALHHDLIPKDSLAWGSSRWFQRIGDVMHKPDTLSPP